MDPERSFLETELGNALEVERRLDFVKADGVPGADDKEPEPERLRELLLATNLLELNLDKKLRLEFVLLLKTVLVPELKTDLALVAIVRCLGWELLLVVESTYRVDIESEPSITAVGKSSVATVFPEFHPDGIEADEEA